MYSKIKNENNNKSYIYVVLDNVRSAQNTGSFFRTCDSLGVDKIFLCGITSIPPNKEILKTGNFKLLLPILKNILYLK